MSDSEVLLRIASALERLATTAEREFKTTLLAHSMTVEEFDALIPGEEAHPEVEGRGTGMDLNRVKVLEEAYRRTHGVPPPEDWDPDDLSADEREVRLGPGVDERSPAPHWIRGLS